MRRPIATCALVGCLTLLCDVAGAGLLGTTPIAVSCGTALTVGASNTGQTLALDATDPILSTTCAGNGLTVINKGASALNQRFTIDCNTNQATPITGTAGIGIMLKGLNLAVHNCYVHGFTTGILSVGDGADIEDSQVEQATGNGFFVHSGAKLTSANIVGITFTGNRAFGNGGWGFLMNANEISGGTGSFFNNIADRNGKGGFYIKGDGNSLSGSEAFNNGGPGFVVLSNSCCSGSLGQSFDTAVATFNTGPGIVYIARNDGSNCVGGAGPTCTGGTFFPLGFDTTAGGISAFGNGGSCPPGALPYLKAEGVCPIVTSSVCSPTLLSHCP